MIKCLANGVGPYMDVSRAMQEHIAEEHIAEDAVADNKHSFTTAPCANSPDEL